jgi:integrase
LEVPDMLRPHLLAQAANKLPTAPLFSADGGGHMNRDRVRDATKRLCAIAGIKIVCAHSLRATAASIAKEAGAMGHDVARSLGHTSEVITERHYLAPGTSQRAATRATMRVIDGGAR